MKGVLRFLAWMITLAVAVYFGCRLLLPRVTSWADLNCVVAVVGIVTMAYGMIGLFCHYTGVMEAPPPAYCAVYIAAGIGICTIYRVFLYP